MPSLNEGNRIPRIYAWPWRLPGNRYLELFYDALLRQGLDIRPLRWRFLPLFQVARDKHRPKWLHFHWVGYSGKYLMGALGYWLIIFAGMTMAKSGGAKIAWTMHNLVPHNSKWTKIDRFAYSLLLAKYVDVIFAHSEWTRNQVISRYRWEGPTPVLYHGNYINVYQQHQGSRYPIRLHYGAPDGTTVFLFVGALSRYKGLDNLITSFKKISNESMRLWIVGKGESLAPYIEKLIGDDSRITLDARFVPDDELADILNAADVVVLPYKEITTSGSMILAASYGKPIIAPNVASIPEYATSNTALLYDPTVEGGLEWAISEALRRDLKCMGERALDLAKTWDWDDAAKEFACIYRSE